MNTLFSFKENLVKLEARHKVYIKLHARAPNWKARNKLSAELYEIHTAILFTKLKLNRN